jgi:hypothetical protein
VSTDQQLLERLRQINPVPTDAERPQAMWSTAALFADVEQRSGTMKTNEDIQQLQHLGAPPERPRLAWRGPLIAAAAAAVVLLVVGAGLWLVGDGSQDAPVVDEPAPTTVVPALSTDLSNMGEVLTAAHNADDPEVLLGLFSEDAELKLGGDAFTPNEIRAEGPLPGIADNYAYDRPFARIFNDRYDYSSCQVNGDRVLCDMTVTTDYLKPLLGSFQFSVAIAVQEGKIVQLNVAQTVDPIADLMFDFQDWTQQNYPEEAKLMWVSPANPDAVPTEESALLHLRLGDEYAQLQP